MRGLSHSVEVLKLIPPFLLLISLFTSPISNAQAQSPQVIVRVLIETADWADCSDPVNPPADVYWVVTIGSRTFSTEDDPWTINVAPFTVNKEFSNTVDFTLGSIPVVIEQWDDDGGSDDDKCNLQPGPGRELNFRVDLATCTISGDVTGTCDETIGPPQTTGMTFRITVDEPPSAPGVDVRCTHDPIWPQPGDTMTITATALDGALAPRLADKVEIWVDDPTAPVASVIGTTLTYTTPALTDTTVAYGCRVEDAGLVAWTGWRVTGVGMPAEGRAAPVLFRGVNSSRLDIVFMADWNSYTGPTDPTFLNDVFDVIHDAYFQGTTTYSTEENFFLRNQDLFNFWIALDTGHAGGFAGGRCEIDLPSMRDYTFADTIALLHSNTLRDCAPGNQRVFSSEPFNPGTVLHETGHRPFGLADEYCCDGGYFQANPHPNLYGSNDTCGDDSFNLGRVPSNCRDFLSDTNERWFTSEPIGDDLMEDSGNRTPRAADRRRIEWFFDECRGANC